MFDFFSGSSNRTQTTRLLLLAVIVLTIPCYCLGAVMLAYAPDSASDRTAVPTDSTLGGATQLPRFTPTVTPFATWTPTQLGLPLGATPGQLYLPTNTPFYVPPTITPFPTWTPVPYYTLTLAPTLTPVPSATLAPTSIPAPTNTPVPQPTNTPLPTNTPVPANTEPPAPTFEAPTQEVLPSGNDSAGSS